MALLTMKKLINESIKFKYKIIKSLRESNTQLYEKQTLLLNMSVFRFGLYVLKLMDNEDCWDMPWEKLETWKCTFLFSLVLVLAINNIVANVFLKIHELANAKFFHWKLWPGFVAK